MGQVVSGNEYANKWQTSNWNLISIRLIVQVVLSQVDLAGFIRAATGGNDLAAVDDAGGTIGHGAEVAPVAQRIELQRKDGTLGEVGGGDTLLGDACCRAGLDAPDHGFAGVVQNGTAVIRHEFEDELGMVGTGNEAGQLAGEGAQVTLVIHREAVVGASRHAPSTGYEQQGEAQGTQWSHDGLLDGSRCAPSVGPAPQRGNSFCI